MELATAILLVSTLTINGLVAYWAATTRWHWFVRTGLAAIEPGLALAAGASEIALTLAGQAVVVAAGVGYFARRRRQQCESQATAWRFSLASFLLATLLASVGAAVVAKFPAGNRLLFQSMSLLSVCSGLMTLLGTWGATRWRWGSIVGVVGATLLGGFLLALPLAWFDWFAMSLLDPAVGWPPEVNPHANMLQTLMGQDFERPVAAWLVAGPMTALFTTLLTKLGIAAGAICATRDSIRTRTTLRQRLAAGGFVVMSAAMALPAAFAWQRMAFPDPIPVVNLPVPNGIEKIHAAGELLKVDLKMTQGTSFSDLIDTRPKLEAVVRQSEPALALLRRGLAEEAAVVPNYTERDLMEKIERMMATRDLGRAVDAAGELAVLQQRWDDAVQHHLDSVRLGMAFRQGGLLIDSLPGIAMAREGVDGLRKIRRQLSAEQRRQAIETLAKLYLAMEWHGEFERRDRLWSQHSLGWHGRLELALTDIAGGNLLFDSETYGANCVRERVQIALLIIELALLNHAETHGELPASLAELELAARDTILADPYRAGSEYRYDRQGDGFLLYSVGVDGVDDGGAPPELSEFGNFSLETKGDLTLDSSFSEE